MMAVSYSSSIPQPFGDKSFKCFRLTGHLLSNICISVFYKIISACSWLSCCPGAAYYYNSLSQYHENRGIDFVKTYLKHGDRVLNFSMNTSLHVDVPLPKGVSEREALNEMYGKKRVKKWMRIGTKKLPLKKNLLKRRVMNHNGSCLGVSFESCRKYLQGIERGLSPYEAILRASRWYEKGATDKADLLQIFGNALRVKTVKSVAKRQELLAQQIGITGDACFGFPSVKVAKKETALRRFINKLPEDAYVVRLIPKQGPGHALLVVKDEEDYYYFDSEEGVIRFTVNELAKQLQEDRKNLGGDRCEIAFFSYELL